MMRLSTKLFTIAAVLAPLICPATDYYVATDGDDSAAGTLEAPWRTIQHAAETVAAGDNVLIRGGTYEERIEIKVSGSTSAGSVTFQPYGDESAILDGTTLTAPDGDTAMIWIANQHHVTIKGLVIRNYATSDADKLVCGVFVTGTSTNISLLNNQISGIKQETTSSEGNAHAVAFYGNDGDNSINNVTIDGNVISDCSLGASEALVLNGNIETFTISNNTIHDCDNIGIDLIGWEGTAPVNDQARNGTVSGNTVHDITSYGNPSYGTDRSAGGIYVDGGENIVIERNVVYKCDLGIEVASEAKGGTTEDIVVRDNLLYWNNVAGLAFGGYDSNRGVTLNCHFLHNTLFQNDTTKSGNGDVMIQKSHDNSFKDNLVVCNDQNIILSNWFKSADTYDNTFDYNLYYGPAGADGTTFVWQNDELSSFTAYQTISGQDANSLFADPVFSDASATPPNLRPTADSPAVNAGDPAFAAATGETDLDGNPRVSGGRTDCGAYEFQSGEIYHTLSVTVTPENAGQATGAGSHPAGTTVTVTAEPADGYEFDSWSGDLTGSDNPATLLMDSDKSVTATFAGGGTTKTYELTIGSVATVTASEVDSSLSKFSSKPKFHVAYENGQSETKLKVIDKINAKNTPTSVNAEWKSKKPPLFDQGDFRGELISEKIKDDPIVALKFDGLYVSLWDRDTDTDVDNKKLDADVYLVPPEITAVTGDWGEEDGVFTVTGEHFGAKPPKILVEYLKNGDADNPKYKKCKIDKGKSLRFKDAKGRSNKSCMVVLESDATATTPIGHSQVAATYPKLKDDDEPTGCVILDNGVGLAVFTPDE